MVRKEDKLTTETATETTVAAPAPIKRTDVHRPSAIIPSEYSFVAYEYIPGAGAGDLGACSFLQRQREIIKAHMQRTGGTYSSHVHGGNCMICGAWAIYTVLFYHQPTNTYIRTGMDCAAKMDLDTDGRGEQFRRAVHEAREAQAGKRKAQALLSDHGMARAWDVYSNPPVPPAVPLDSHGDSVYATEWNQAQRDAHDAAYRDWFKAHYEERTIGDIVGKLVKYGSISEKQYDFIGTLLARIDTRAQREAERAAVKAAEAEHTPDVPNDGKRIEVAGEVLSTRVDYTNFGSVTKMLVKTDAGYKLWGTAPSALLGNEPLKGKRIAFKAAVERSAKDPKFGFISRPTSARFIEERATVAAIAQGASH